MKTLVLSLFFVALLSVPSVLASPTVDTGIASLNTAMNTIYSTIGAIFNVPMSPTVFTGVLKFLFFILTFAVFFWAGRKKIWTGKGDTANAANIDNRTAGIVAATLAAISTWYIPQDYFLNVMSIYPAIVALLLILPVPVGAAAAAFLAFRDTPQKKVSPFLHALGAILLMMAWGFTSLFYERAVTMAGSLGVFKQIIEVVLSWIVVFLPLMAVVKLIQAMFAFFNSAGAGDAGGAGGAAPAGGGLLNRAGDFLDNVKRFGERNAERGRLLPAVSGIAFEVDRTQPTQTLVKWNLLDGARRIEIQYRNLTLGTGWQPTPEGIIAPAGATQFSSGLIPTNDRIQVRIRGYDVSDRPGAFGYSGIGAPNAGPPPVPVTFAAELLTIQNALDNADRYLSAAETAASTPPLNVWNPATGIMTFRPVAVPLPQANPLRGNILSARDEIRAALQMLEQIMRSHIPGKPYGAAPPPQRAQCVTHANDIPNVYMARLQNMANAYQHATHRVFRI